MHNHRGYDSHLIIKNAFEINEKIGNRRMNRRPNNNDKVMSISIGGLNFTDSMEFVQSSRESLVNNLYDKEDKFKHFTHMYKNFSRAYRTAMPEEYIPLLVRRPYKQKLDYVALPPKEAFYSVLYKEHVSDKNYEHALLVFNTLLCVLFKDYPLIHLQKDVL